MQIVRRLLQAVVVVLTLVVGAAAAAIVVSQTAWFKDWLRGYIVREANQYLNGQLSIGRLGGNLFFGVELEDVAVSMDGSQVVAVKDLGLDYNAFELVSKGLSVNTIRLNKPVLYLRRDGDGWSIGRLVKKQEQEADRKGPRRPITVGDIGISDGSMVIDQAVGTSGVVLPKRLDRIDAKLSFKYEPVRYSVNVAHVSFEGDGGISVRALAGGVAVRNDTLYVDKLSLRTKESSLSVDGAVQQYLTNPLFNVRVSSDKLSLPEIGRVVPAAAGARLEPAFDLTLSGPLERLGVEMNVRSSAGQVTGRLVADLAAPGQGVGGDLALQHLDLAPILNDPAQRSDITANAHLDLRASSWSDMNSLRGAARIDAPRIAAAGYSAEHVVVDAQLEGRRVAIKSGQASAYGATATAAGVVTFPESGAVTYELRGAARNVDLRKLPQTLGLPSAETDVNTDYHVTGRVARAQAAGSKTRGSRSRAVQSDIDGEFKFLESSVPGATIASGSNATVSVSPGRTGYQGDVTLRKADLQKIGEAFDIKPLADDRYKSSLNLHVAANGTGARPEEMMVTANGTITDSSILGGRIPELTFDGGVSANTIHLSAHGEFAGFDPSVASEKPAFKGELGGKLNVNATLRDVFAGVNADNVEGTARLDMTPSTLGGLSLDSAQIDGDFHNAAAAVRVFNVKGRDLDVTARGTLALNRTDQSNLQVTAESTDLDELGKVIDQPLTGIAKLDATVTGNRTELQATGHVSGNDVGYGENGALSLATNYTIRVPDLDFEKATASAESTGTFVKLAGVNINEIQAKTNYDNRQLSFNATAKQPRRSANVAGALLLHPDHQEVHLQQFGLQAEGVDWQLEPDVEPAIQYDGGGITIEDLRLVNGNQTFSVDGTFGHEGDALVVSLSQVDLAGVEALLLRGPQFSGRLDGSVTVTGTKDVPEAKAEFAVSGGGFRQFRYESFNGAAIYGVKGVSIDTRLEQNPTTWLTAKGYLPIALLKGGVAAGHRDTPALEDTVDLHIESSPIDLGLVQGFATALTDVTGTLQAKVDIGGTAGDPRPTGAITIENAAFTVAPTGVKYTDLDGRVEFQSDRVHVDEIKVLDNHGQPMTLSGDLAIHERELGGVDIALKAHDFKVIDNKMGNVRVDTEMHLSGELQQPRIEGSVAVTTGEIGLDPIIASAGESAYSTKQTEYANPASSSETEPSASTSFQAMQMFLHVTVPKNDLVVKGTDLQLAGSPIGLGALNLTIGGDLWISKVPYDLTRLTGTVNTVRGTYDFQGRRFEILRDGTVRFEGLDEIDPALDVKTQRVIQAVTANVNIRGTLKNPEIVLSSNPPLEEADVLALIVFNQPLNQLGETQQLNVAQRAQALASGAAVGQLAQSIGKALNLDTFEINAAPETGGGPQFTVGQQVGQNLYVKLQQGIGDSSQTNFVLEYEIAKWLRLRTNVLQGASTQQQLFQRVQGSGADLLFFFSY